MCLGFPIPASAGGLRSLLGECPPPLSTDCRAEAGIMPRLQVNCGEVDRMPAKAMLNGPGHGPMNIGADATRNTGF